MEGRVEGWKEGRISRKKRRNDIKEGGKEGRISRKDTKEGYQKRMEGY